MFGLLRQRGLALLLGDQRTGSTPATGATFMAQIVPPLLLGSVAGVFVDRWDRRRTMIIADLARALLLLLLLTVHTRADLPHVYIVAFLVAAIARVFGPAKGALIPVLQAIGGLLGGMIAGRISAQLSPTRLFGLSVGLVGGTIVIAANVPILPLMVPLVALVGIPVVGWLVGAQTVLQDSVADRYRGRILGTYGTTSALTRLGGMGLARVLGDHLGVVPMLNVSGGLHIAAGFGALVLLRAARSVHIPAEDLPVRTG